MIGILVQCFGSIKQLVKELTSYLEHIYFQLNMLDDKMLNKLPICFRKSFNNKNKDLPIQNIKFSELLNLYKQSKTRINNKINNDENEIIEQENDINLKLKKNKYRICDLDEMIQISQILDRYNEDELSLNEKYQWCLAPINLENPLVLSLFPTWVEEYINDKIVYLHTNNKIINKNHIPNTSEGLLQMEQLHHTIEAYIWLGYHYKKEIFVDMEIAMNLCKECSHIIELGLKFIGKNKNKKKYI